MSQEGYSYNPVNPNYTFNGNNTNYHFIQPGRYELYVNTNANMSANRDPNAYSYEIKTDIHFPNSESANVPASPARDNGSQHEKRTALMSPMKRDVGSSASSNGSSINSVLYSTPPPKMRNQTNAALMQSPMKRDGFASPAPVSSPRNLPGGASHSRPDTPRPNLN